MLAYQISSCLGVVPLQRAHLETLSHRERVGLALFWEGTTQQTLLRLVRACVYSLADFRPVDLGPCMQACLGLIVPHARPSTSGTMTMTALVYVSLMCRASNGRLRPR